jgi:hypothetical protein
VRYVPHGGTQAGVVVNAGFAANGGNLNGCQLMAANATAGLTKAMYFEGSMSSYGYVFSATNAAEDWTTKLTLPTTANWKTFNSNPYYGKQVISNRARTRLARPSMFSAPSIDVLIVCTAQQERGRRGPMHDVGEGWRAREAFACVTAFRRRARRAIESPASISAP